MTDPRPEPSQLALVKDLLANVRALLSATERQLAEHLGQSRTWAELAAEWGRRADTLRRQLARAYQRVAWPVVP